MSKIFEGLQPGYSALLAYADEKRRHENNQTVAAQYDPKVYERLRRKADAIAQRYCTSGVPTLPPPVADRHVPRQPSLDPLADGIRDHYLAQARSADQVRGMIAASTRPMDEDDGA